jgi:hypothetical protein
MHPTGFEPAIPVEERPQTHALERVFTGIGSFSYTQNFVEYICWKFLLVNGIRSLMNIIY